MATPKQKAEERPISFVLHNMATGAEPVEVPLVIRPEDLTRTETSRLSTVQTLGGAWADNFGEGVPVVQLSGHTGWGAGSRPDGFAAFQFLHENIFKEWHKQRAAALKNGLDPDLVNLIFSDKLDDFTWVVAPTNFVLRRNKSRPLLSQYQISLTYLSSDVASTLAMIRAKQSRDLTSLQKKGLASLTDTIQEMADWVEEQVKTGLSVYDKAVAPIVKVMQAITNLTAKVLSAFKAIDTITNSIVGLATSLSKIAGTVAGIIGAIKGLGGKLKSAWMKIRGAFENAFCLLKNVFKTAATTANYDGIYGASSCSSTAGGRPVSAYAGTNPLPNYFPPINPSTSPSITSAAAAALAALLAVDPVLAAPSNASILANCQAIIAGITLPDTSRHITILPSDTLKSIALRELGNKDRYVEIALLNGLSFPYISTARTARVKTYGDDLKVPQA